MIYYKGYKENNLPPDEHCEELLVCILLICEYLKFVCAYTFQLRILYPFNLWKGNFLLF